MDHDQDEAEDKAWGGVREGAGRPKGRPSLRRAAQAITEVEEKFPGWSPVLHLAAVANDESLPPEIRLDAAKAAAPFLHSRPKPVELDPDALVDLERRLIAAKIEETAKAVKSDDTLADRLARAKPNDPEAAKLFPSEQKPQRMSDEGFQDLKPYDAKAVTSCIDGFAGSAIAEGDTDRAQELQAAGAALTQDFAKAGTDPADLTEAFDIVKERHADTAFGPVPEEKLVADYNATMSSLAEEGVRIADIDAARQFIADLEMVAPGTMHTLEATGAGNDARLIRKAIAEARRRGY